MDVRDFFLPGGGPGRLTVRRLRNLIDQLPASSRLQTKLLGAAAYERWSPSDYLIADVKDWLQYVFLVNLANATGKKPPEFRPAPRPTDKLIAEQNRARLLVENERSKRILHAMRTGDWSNVPEIADKTFEVNH